MRRIGCVSFLNSKPLIDGLEGGRDPEVRLDVPSGLLADLERGEVDIALCPAIDYQRAATALAVVPVGGIGCEGPTYTVRLFSRVPLAQIRAVHTDTDSHTSVALLRIVLAKSYGLLPELIAYDPRAQRVCPGPPRLTLSTAKHPTSGSGRSKGSVPDSSDDSRIGDRPRPDSVLLIGDKVVTAAPPPDAYPHQLDLGEAWHTLTGLPFVFAVWMARADADLGDLPALLDRTRQANAARTDAIVARHAAPLGWPPDLARRYLGSWLRYPIGPRELQAIARFWAYAHELALIGDLRPLRIWRATERRSDEATKGKRAVQQPDPPADT